MNNMMELVVKSSNLLSVCGAQARPADQLKILEMSLNKEEKLLDKTKLVIVKFEKLYLVIPFTITKLEVRVRNLIINSRLKFE